MASETQQTTVEESADDIFAKAFEQLSAADNLANQPAVVEGPTGPEQRTEADRAMSEAQRDQATFAATGPGPTGPSDAARTDGSGHSTTGPTGVTGSSGDGGLPPDDAQKAAAEAARVAAAAAEAARTAAPALTDDDLVKRLAGLIKKAPVEEPVADQPVQQVGVDVSKMFSPDELKFLGDYAKEYPDIAKGEWMRRRVEYAQLVQYMFGEWTKQVQQHFTPRFEMLEGLLQRTHAGDLQQQVPTYNNALRDKVVAWAATQPAYKRVAYEYVINQGTVDDVRDLIDTYNQSTGQTPVVQADPKAAQAAAAEAARVAAAARLAPVQGKGTGRGVGAGVVPSDFDGSFDHFTKALANI